MNYNIKVNTSFNFFKEAFTKNFSDSDGDSACEVVILSLPDSGSGTLKYKGVDVKVNDCFPVANSSYLSFLRLKQGVINTYFNFKISDNNQNKLYSKMAKVTINIASYTNRAPDQVGDLSVPMIHGATRIFTSTDFTSGLTPPYHDPEGDAPSKLKVLTLPNSGALKLNGANVNINQEIVFSMINSGLFSYVSDSLNKAAIDTEFTFAISDIGSGLYTS